jgi:hypothetical protein
MPKVVKSGTCEPKNKKTALEALRKGGIGLNAASRASSLRKDT